MRILISTLGVAVIVVSTYVLYRRYVRALAAGADQHRIDASRLTSEHLHRLAHPPWRVVHEIDEKLLGGVDHVLAGPVGIVAIVTLLSDRPDTRTGSIATGAAGTPDRSVQAVAASAIHIAAVDDVVSAAGFRCERLLKVYWGRSDPSREAAVEESPGVFGVEGQRLQEVLSSWESDESLTPSQVDLAWSTVATAIGRPDPLS